MIEIRNLTKRFGDVTAVDDLSLSIGPGELFGFIGHNGAGKTTTIKALCGLISVDSGDISVCGHSMNAEPLVCKSQLAYIPDNPDMYEFLSGIKYLNFICDVYGVEKARRSDLISDYCGRFEITGKLADRIDTYSHGTKQKLALVSAFIHEPKVLVMDEPFVGLDPVAAHILKREMADLCGRGGAIFFSTHVLEVAEKLCTSVGIIKNGRLIACGATADIIGSGSLEDAFLETSGLKTEAGDPA
ncbi:MAG: ABC transporter ATP-binding protein [Clostridia bacterium]|nr:ABC transporter ATP-binding protein [Clostridia bacterium]